MKPTILAVAAALALGTLAACDRSPNPQQRPATTPPATTAPATTAPATGTAGTGSSATPSTPANMGTPSQAEKKEGSNPTQGQVDPKQPAQQKDFQQKGDGAGPKPGG